MFGSVRKGFCFIAGSIASFVTLGVLTVSCSDDNDDKEEVKKANYTYDELSCCGKDDGSATFKACVNDFRTNKTCKTEPPKKKYTDEEIDCCSMYDEGSESFEDCVSRYRENETCIEKLPTYYGMPVNYGDLSDDEKVTQGE